MEQNRSKSVPVGIRCGSAAFIFNIASMNIASMDRYCGDPLL